MKSFRIPVRLCRFSLLSAINSSEQTECDISNKRLKAWHCD